MSMPPGPAAGYTYAVRICLPPGYYEDERLAELKAFCAAAGAQEVILFANYEELNTGHVTPEEQEQWLGVIRRAKEALAVAGLTVSLNPWETILHGDRGRRLKPGQLFRLMVDVQGRQATAQVCPLCPEWQEHIAATYARYASVAPSTLWIEDDFRFHNHAPLTWGGCFCEEHLRVIAERFGQPLTRAQLVSALTAPGEPHPVRQLWLDLNGETLVAVAQRIRAAVESVSPETRMGLMTSVPATHCAEGRRWEQLIESLGGANRCVVRPHLPAYREIPPGRYLWLFTLSRQTAAALPSETTLLPELDNGPHSLFSKSRALTAFQISLASVLSTEGITLNIFDPPGSGPILSEQYQSALVEVRPLLEYLRGLDFAHGRPVGITTPFSPRSSYTLHTDARYRADTARYDLGQASEPRLEWLYPDEGKWTSLLTCFGFSTVVTKEHHPSGQTLAISGQWLRNLQPDEIIRLFAENATLLDGAAALTLCDLGLGPLAGITGVRDLIPQDAARVSFEEVVEGTALLGKSHARFSAQGSVGPTALFDYDATAQVVTELRDCYGQTAGPGLALARPNCLILPYVFPDSPDTCLLSTLRRELFLSLLPRLAAAPEHVTSSLADPYLAVYRRDFPGRITLLLANASTDAVAAPKLLFGDLPDGTYQAEWCDNRGRVSTFSLKCDCGRVTLPEALPAMRVGALALQWEKKGPPEQRGKNW